MDGARTAGLSQQNLQLFQLAVARFVEAQALEVPPAIRLLDLVSEAGEVAKELLTGTRYGREEFRPGAAWPEELADLFFALVCVANSPHARRGTTADERAVFQGSQPCACGAPPGHENAGPARYPRA